MRGKPTIMSGEKKTYHHFHLYFSIEVLSERVRRHLKFAQEGYPKHNLKASR
jgi:hypothetical protein